MLSNKKKQRAQANESLLKALNVGKYAVAAKKAELDETQLLVNQASDEARFCTSSFMDQLTTIKPADEGILFIDFEGTILHANQAAHKVLEMPEDDKLIGRSVETLLTTKQKVKQRIRECSVAIFKMFTESAIASLSQLTDAFKSFKCMKVSSVEVALNEPIQVPYSTGKLNVRLTLLDPQPSALEDVTYLCKLYRA